MTRYQQDLELKRKECKERFGCTQSGNCTHCGKYIQMDLGKHIAFYHLDLRSCGAARSCGVQYGKGTAQDCIDHMRRTHMLPLSAKAANLAKYLPAWTVTRDQWSKMLMPCVSGVAIDTLLFSCVGSPLCHRYRLISHTGSHAAFRGTYLRHLRLFIEEADDAVRRRLHRQPTQNRSATVVESTEKPASGALRPPVGHKIVSRARRRCPESETLDRSSDGGTGRGARRPWWPDSRQEPSAPAVDPVTGKCKPGRVSGTVSSSPLTLDMTVACTPDPVQ